MRGTRSQGRSFALQLLYQAEMNEELAEASASRFWEEQHPSRKARAFAEALVEATLSHMSEIDARLGKELEHWKLGRLSVVVRNLLRMAVCEMLVVGEVPFPVVIDESVELARRFMDEESARFVNSVLEKCWINASAAQGGAPASQEGT
ncbi:MAG: transcription antitermination factor NusB [SAR324 cluster bacterium]|nr:transcription antitermination factor NusB [SAR324 cluster bacterium]MCZ6728629.1 transcription antitermination factor NusB [SAR324 cluster bacterium]